MTSRFAAALALTALTIPLVAQDKPAPAKPTGIMAELQGAWTMTASNGEAMPAGQELVTTVTDNRYERTVNGQVVERGTFKIDESQKPMTVDISVADGPDAGQSAVGIFQLNGKTLTVKFAQPGSTVRPTDFAVADGFQVLVMAKK